MTGIFGRQAQAFLTGQGCGPGARVKEKAPISWLVIIDTGSEKYSALTWSLVR